jgi:hypothetical protein
MCADYFADYADVSEPVIFVLRNLRSNPRNLREPYFTLFNNSHAAFTRKI